MRALADPAARRVVLVMGAQMGKTEVQLNAIGWRLDVRPVPVIYVGPTRKQVTTIAQDRVAPMIEGCATLAARLERGQRDRVLEKYLAGVRLGFAWAGSATELASHAAGLVLIDERDRMISDVSAEGDPVELAAARTHTYRDGKVVIVGTWTVRGASPTQMLWEAGTMERFAWRCPECASRFVPSLAALAFDEASPEAARRSAHVACTECGAALADRHRAELNAGGAYVAHRLTESGDLVPVPERDPHALVRSFWVSGLCSPFRSFGDLAADLVAARASGEPERVQVVVNTGAGELYELAGDAPPHESVLELRRDYAPGELPAGVQIITAGVDVQKRGLYYVIRGWGFNAESWLLRHGYLAGDTEFDAVWVLLQRALTAPHYRAPGSSPAMAQRAFVDSGYRPGESYRRPEHQVYLFARRSAGLAYPTKGHDTLDRPMRASWIDVQHGGRLIKRGAQLWHLNTDHLKSWIYARLQWPENEPGAWNLHRDTDEDYARQVVAEQVTTTKSGRRIWVRASRHNHYLDCEVNAYAAALSLGVHELKPLPETPPARPAPVIGPAPAVAPPPPPPAAGGFVARPTGSFFRR